MAVAIAFVAGAIAATIPFAFAAVAVTIFIWFWSRRGLRLRRGLCYWRLSDGLGLNHGVIKGNPSEAIAAAHTKSGRELAGTS